MNSKWLIAGFLILVEVALCGLMSASLWAGVNRLGDFRLDMADWRPKTISATATEEAAFAVDGRVTLHVNQETDFAVGDVTVVGGLGDEVTVVASKTAWGVDQAGANTALAELQLKTAQAANRVDINVIQPRVAISVGEQRASRIDLVITVPSGSDLRIYTNFGNVSIEGVDGQVEVRADFGEARLSKIRGGNVSLDLGFGSARLEQVRADDLTVSGEAGEVRLADVEASGVVDIGSKFGEVRFESGAAGEVKALTQGGEVRLADLTVAGSVTAHSDFGVVDVDNVTATSYDLKSNSGQISLTGASGPVKAHTDFGDVRITEATDVSLEVSTKNGSIEFEGEPGAGPHTLKTEFGSIRLSLPADAELDVDLQTSFGSIESELPITLSGSQSHTHWTGTLNGGGASLTASTQNGSITLDILN